MDKEKKRAAANKIFDLKEGEVTILKYRTPKETETYQFFGKAILPGSIAKLFRLWKTEAKEEEDYFKGYALDSLEDFKGLPMPEDEDETPGIISFFRNPEVELTEEGKRRPLYLGKIKAGENEFIIRLWKKDGPKGEFYTGQVGVRDETVITSSPE